ncbi:MAG: hypothetical protein P8Y65_01520 [Campylobacterales bacterium]
MKTFKLAALLLGAALFTGIGATSAFAKCSGEKVQTPAGKCSGEEKAGMGSKCGNKTMPAKPMNGKCSGEKKKEKIKGKCGQGKCSG